VVKGQVLSAAGLGNLTPRWVDADDVNVDYHLRTVASPEPGNRRWLLNFAAAMAESGFDKSRPLWEMVVAEGLDGGGAALVLKVHHSVTDGVGGVKLLLTLLEASRHPGPPLADLAPAESSATRPLPSRVADVARGLSPSNVMRTAASVGRLLAPSGGRRSPVFVGHSTDLHFDTCERPLDDLKRAGKGAGASVNDVFLSALAGGLRRYHVAHGRDVEALRLTLPVSLRKPGDPLGGNRFVPLRFALPVSEADPFARIQHIHELSKRWRSEPALPLTDAIAGILNILPPQVTTAVMQSLLKGVDVVATNVPGVPSRCYIAGAEMTRQFAFAPLSGAAINAALVSHAGMACIGVNMDSVAVPDPDVLMACLSEGIDEVIAIGTTERRTV
jgi:diacylglycerol O-acyltransferase